MARHFLDSRDPSSDRQWREVVAGETPQLDNGGYLAGNWGLCLVAATCLEHTERDWETQYSNGPAGQVIAAMRVVTRERRIMRGAEKLEEITHEYMERGGLQPIDNTPDAWGIQAAEALARDGPIEHIAPSCSSSCSRSGSGSRSSSVSGSLRDRVSDAPLCARIGDALEKNIQGMPSEIVEALAAKGATCVERKHLKTSFHSTWLFDLEPPLLHEGKPHHRVIVQVIGIELGDKDIFGFDTCARTLTRASELAAQAGVRVPLIFASGSMAAGDLGHLDFVIEEFVTTQTVEDEVLAPGGCWHAARQDVEQKLQNLSLADVDTTPLPRFNTFQEYFGYLQGLVPSKCESLQRSLQRFVDQCELESVSWTPSLVHQDINGGNLLCSPVEGSDKWALDALIDWESAVVCDWRMLGREEPFAIAAQFGAVVKGAHLAERYVNGSLPRCELDALVENYARAAKKLQQKNVLTFEPWRDLVTQCQSGTLASSTAS